MTVKIPLKKYVMDESLSWEERYAKLDAHHLEETQWLIAELTRTREALEQARFDAIELEWQAGNLTHGEKELEYARWLASTASSSSWWPRLPESTQALIRQQIARRAGGTLIGGEITDEEKTRYRAMLDRLAEQLGLP